MGENYLQDAVETPPSSGAIVLASREGRLLDKVEFTSHVDDYETLSRYAALVAGISEAAGSQLGLGRPLEIEVAFTDTRIRIHVEPELLRLLLE
jgi:predicted regulator of Ras-like GTPase activity (Roadblock/LC7/MglB family)